MSTWKTYNVDSTSRPSDRPKTRAIMMAHTLGNPFDLGAVMELCERHGLWLVEDTCDAVGATYGGKPGRLVRRPGDGELLSRPPHHDG